MQESACNELRTEIPCHGLRGHPDISVFSCTQSDMIKPPRVDVSLPLPIPTLADNLILSDALSLLKHYSNHIIALLTPYQHTKTPWHVLFVPHAKSCLADLAIGETPDRARLTAFFGTLATSALSLSGGAQAGHGVWAQQARSHHGRARDHCRAMMVGAYDTPKTAKYKSILMALHTMIQLSSLLGELDDVEFYFLEAEKFIRLKGLHRRKSRKVRLLHHCYVYQRMLYESICASRVDSSHRRLVLEAVGSSGVVACGQDTPHFRAPSWRNLQAEMLREKTQDEGENDLLLEQPGKWPGTLYPEIFGIPEILVFFLSHVIRLGYEKDGAAVDDVPSPGALRDFLDRAKALERCINQLIPPLHETAHDAHRSGPPVGDVLQCMVAAIANGLSIFFYRRIYDADASILQQRVFAVRDCLAKCERDGSGSRQGSLGLIWPAFIAAREAEDINLQAFFAMWFRARAAESGLDIFMLALKNAEVSWEAKKLSNGINVCWIDLINPGQSVLG